MILNFSKLMHFNYNTILSINIFFQLGAKCIKKKEKWSPCTKECFGEKSRMIYHEKIGKDKPGTKKLQCSFPTAETKSCNTDYRCKLARKLKNRRYVVPIHG